MELGLEGRVAVVTGASKGIGRAIALGLAAEGVNLVLLARGQEPLDAAATEIAKEHGVQALALRADVRSTEEVNAARDSAVEQFQTIHILVNNAGGPIRRIERQIEWPDTDWMDDVNLKMMGMLRATQSFLPHMARDGSGRVINISGIAGTSVLVPALTHGFNNSAMNHVTGYLAEDFAKYKINVNAVIPGLIGTEWRQEWADNMGKQQGKTREEFLDAYSKRIGILTGRWGTMEEVADTVVFLASDRASYITGAQIAVDGGYGVNARQ